MRRSLYESVGYVKFLLLSAKDRICSLLVLT
jgi:hypothetical protein